MSSSSSLELTYMALGAGWLFVSRAGPCGGMQIDTVPCSLHIAAITKFRILLPKLSTGKPILGVNINRRPCVVAGGVVDMVNIGPTEIPAAISPYIAI